LVYFMPASSIAKIVGLVAFLTVMVIVVVDRGIGNGIVTRIFQTVTREPRTDRTKPPAQAGALGRPHTEKKPKSPVPATESMTVRDLPVIPVPPDAGQEIRTGMNVSQLIELLGDPTLRTTQTQDRRIVERYIYVDRDRHTITVAVLENGRTVRLESRPYARLSLVQPR
jgi:hypothetical protein